MGGRSCFITCGAFGDTLQQGPLEQRLEHLVGEAGLQSLVVGRFAEASQHLHHLVRGLAEGRSLHLARTTGKPASAGETAAITRSYRRILSCQFVRSVEGCLRQGWATLTRGGCSWKEERVGAGGEEGEDGAGSIPLGLHQGTGWIIPGQTGTLNKW